MLAARVARHDSNAFAALYDRYARMVYVLAAHMLGPSDAEEATQEIFMRLWNKAAQFDATRGSFAAWFMTIARHYVLDEVRHRRQQPTYCADDIDQLIATPRDDVDIAEQAWLSQCGAAAQRALADLPPEQRRVIVLAYFGGMSQSEIAQSLAVPLGTVKKRIRLGVRKLRAALRAQGLLPALELGSSTSKK